MLGLAYRNQLSKKVTIKNLNFINLEIKTMVVNIQDSFLPISFAKFANFFCLSGCLHVLYLYGGNIN